MEQKKLTTSCLCYSKMPYENCCKPYHEGLSPATALLLMRSRYAAYALHLVDYIIRTTHPANPLFQKGLSEIQRDILQFSSHTEFTGLDILDFKDGENEAFVTFHAHLQQNGRNCSFQEKSRFLKVDGKWLYHSVVSISS